MRQHSRRGLEAVLNSPEGCTPAVAAGGTAPRPPMSRKTPRAPALAPGCPPCARVTMWRHPRVTRASAPVRRGAGSRCGASTTRTRYKHNHTCYGHMQQAVAARCPARETFRPVLCLGRHSGGGCGAGQYRKCSANAHTTVPDRDRRSGEAQAALLRRLVSTRRSRSRRLRPYVTCQRAAQRSAVREDGVCRSGVARTVHARAHAATTLHVSAQCTWRPAQGLARACARQTVRQRAGEGPAFRHILTGRRARIASRARRAAARPADPLRRATPLRRYAVRQRRRRPRARALCTGMLECHERAA